MAHRAQAQKSQKMEQNNIARNIIGEHFGPVVLPVAEILISRFPASLSLSSLIALASPLPASTVRRALLLFMRHNLIKISSRPTEDKLPSPLLYCFEISSIVTRIQFPAYETQARELFGEIVSNIFITPYFLLLCVVLIFFFASFRHFFFILLF